MALIASYTQQPAERLDYDIPCDLEDGDIITAATATVTPAGLTVAEAITDTTVKLWVESGTSGTIYTIEVLIETQLGRKKEVELKFRIRDY